MGFLFLRWAKEIFRSTEEPKQLYGFDIADEIDNTIEFSRSRRGTMASVFIKGPPNPQVHPAAYLRSIYAVRERCQLVFGKAKGNELKHFEVDVDKLKDVTAAVVETIQRDFGTNYASIPPHGRWQHFEVGGVQRMKTMLIGWDGTDAVEVTRRYIDLILVSVLLDAGAGNDWKYKTPGTDEYYRRSEGLAVASLDMFKAGLFSSDKTQPYQVDAKALKALTVEELSRGLQVSEQNPLAGLEGRASLLIRLGDALGSEEVFGSAHRPGYLIGM
jgi:hypothetical protein